MTTGDADARRIIRENHYTRSWPSGKSWVFRYEDALVVMSIPANYNTARWLGVPRNRVWELSRLWAPDGHRPNLLTEAISRAVRAFHALDLADAVVSYADPTASHHGGVYKAASWTQLGQSEEGRAYRDTGGRIIPRRKFHAGTSFTRKAGILALGYAEVMVPGKLRFARGLTRLGKRAVLAKASRFPTAGRPGTNAKPVPPSVGSTMSISITINALDALDLQRQIRTLLTPDTTLSALRAAAAVPASPPVDVSPAATTEATPEPVAAPANGARRSPGRPRKVVEDVTPAPAPGTSDVPAVPDLTLVPASAPEPAPAPVPAPAPAPVPAPQTPLETRTRAVGLLRSAFATGAPGEKAVSQVCQHFGVQKLVDVPLERANELLAMASQAHVSLVGPVPAP